MSKTKFYIFRFIYLQRKWKLIFHVERWCVTCPRCTHFQWNLTLSSWFANFIDLSHWIRLNSGFCDCYIQVSSIVEQIVKYGGVTRPVLGISFAPDQSVEPLGVSGVLVLDAPPNGPAGKAVSSQYYKIWGCFAFPLLFFLWLAFVIVVCFTC